MRENTKIQLNSKRRIQLFQIDQKLTYHGLIEGYPTQNLNKTYLEKLIEQIRGPSALIQPIEETIDLGGRAYPFGAPAKMPCVTCVGRFTSAPVGADDPAFWCSELTVIWLQAQFAFPIAPEALSEIARLDWDRLASNFEV